MEVLDCCNYLFFFILFIYLFIFFFWHQTAKKKCFNVSIDLNKYTDTWQIITHTVNELVASTWAGGTTHDGRSIPTLYGHIESLEEVAC